jgi:hypothetical protein
MLGLRLTTVSFGATSAIVTSIGLIIGFAAAGIAKPTIIAGLLVVGLADNLTDSLSIHIYQEAERLEPHAAFRATLGNFAARLLISLSFVLLVLAFSSATILATCLAWGLVLLAGLTWLVARHRGADVLPELCKHLGMAALVIAASDAIGTLIKTYLQ